MQIYDETQKIHLFDTNIYEKKQALKQFWPDY